MSDLGLKGVKYQEELQKQYKKHVLNWIGSNFNISDYEVKYQEALKKYIESNKKVRLDENDLINEEKKRKRLQSWIEEHDIFSSPKALTKENYLLYNTLNEEKWYSDGYKTLLKPENKPLLDAYNLFTELNTRASENGMLDDIYNAKRWVPNVTDPSLKKSALYALKDGAKSPWYAIEKVLLFAKKHLGFITEVSELSPNLDPLTGKQLRRIPVQYKYLKEGEEKDLSNDLFSIYSKWADHIIKYEMLSNYENRFKMIQLLESLKEKAYAVSNIGNIVKKKNRETGLPTTESETTPKSSSVEQDLERIINNYVYSTNLDVKPPWYKIANFLYDYAAIKYLGINTTAWVANIVGGAFSARLNQGKWFDKNDYSNIGVNIVLGVFNKKMNQYGDNLFSKSRFLIRNLDTRILSEYDRDPSDKYSKSKLKIRDIAFSGFRLGDHFIQDSIAASIFLNTTIIDGKFVNINDLVKAKYDNKIYNTTSNKERKQLIKERNQEIESLKKSSNLFRFVEEKNGKFTLKGIDLSTKEGQSELLSYQNKIIHYTKSAIGNIDEFDKSIARMNWYMKFLTQFKNWMPRVFGSRVQDIEYLYELDDYHYGRTRIFLNAFKYNMRDTTLEMIKSLYLIIPFTNKNNTSNAIIDLAKSQYLIKKSEAISKNQPFDLTEDQFVDIYVTGFNNQLVEFSNLIQFSLAVTAVALAYSGSDDKDKWYWKFLSKVLFKVDRDLNMLYDPEQLTSVVTKGFIPAITSLIELWSVLGEWKDEALGDIGQKLDIEGSEEKSQKAKPLSSTIKATPILIEIHYWLLASSEDYAEFMEREQPKVTLEE